MKASAYITLIALAVTASACAEDSSGEFDVSDVQKHADCLGEVFPFEPDFLTARERQGSVGLFMQSQGGNFQGVDSIYFEVFNASAGSTLDFTQPGSTLEAQALGEFEPGASCPDLVESMYFTGQIQFDEFNPEQDGTISGELVGASIMSGRDDSVIAGSVTGTFEIFVRRGPPYEEFYVN